MTTTELTIGEMLKNLRDVVDARDSLANQDSELARQEAELKYALQRKASEQGVPGFKSDAGAITFNEDLRAKYDPETWESIVKWAVESGNSHIIQRRMTDARVKALMDEGVVLPDGLTLEPYIKTSFRRN
jgi:hypothetical protein